jgi:hypothetical protein
VPKVSPPGKTLKERWPHEAEDRRYFAATSYAVVVGGLLGVLTVPLIIWQELTAAPPQAFTLAVGLMLALGIAIPYVPEPARRWLTLVWKVGAWAAGAALVAALVETTVAALCDEACQAIPAGMQRPPVLIAYVVLVAGSIVAAIFADRTGNDLRRRGPTRP